MKTATHGRAAARAALMVAAAPAPAAPQINATDHAAYFQNPTPPQGFPGGKYLAAMSLDMSLQLEVPLQQYGRFATAKAPQACALSGS